MAGAIGLDIGTSGVRAAELSFGKGGITLEKFGQVAVPEGAVRDGEVLDTVAVAAAIKQLWSATRFRRPPVSVSSPVSTSVTFHGSALRWWTRISRVHFDTEARVAGLDCPVWVAHGDRDMVIPVGMGQQVHESARERGELLLVPRAGHNDVPSTAGERYWSWLARALE